PRTWSLGGGPHAPGCWTSGSPRSSMIAELGGRPRFPIQMGGAVMLDLTKLWEAIRSEGGISRRLLLDYGEALAALPTLPPRAAPRRARAGAFRSRRGQGAQARHLVLVSLPLRRLRQPGRPHAHDAEAGRPSRQAAVRVRLVPELRGRTLHRLRAHGQGPPRP